MFPHNPFKSHLYLKPGMAGYVPMAVWELSSKCNKIILSCSLAGLFNQINPTIALISATILSTLKPRLNVDKEVAILGCLPSTLLQFKS